MNAPLHTPGPWRVRESDEGHLIEMGTYLRNGRKAPHHQVEYEHGICVDDDYKEAQDEFAEAEANARLIAAAPDYDAFTVEALPLLEVLHSTCAAAETRKIVWRCILAGRAALAKARGEQQ